MRDDWQEVPVERMGNIIRLSTGEFCCEVCNELFPTLGNWPTESGREMETLVIAFIAHKHEHA